MVSAASQVGAWEVASFLGQSAVLVISMGESRPSVGAWPCSVGTSSCGWLHLIEHRVRHRLLGQPHHHTREARMLDDAWPSSLCVPKVMSSSPFTMRAWKSNPSHRTACLSRSNASACILLVITTIFERSR